MKMKKIICSLMISVLCFMTAISGVSAASYDTSKIDQAYAKIIEYYKNNNTLVDADKIIAVESLGLEAESNQFDIWIGQHFKSKTLFGVPGLDSIILAFHHPADRMSKRIVTCQHRIPVTLQNETFVRMNQILKIKFTQVDTLLRRINTVNQCRIYIFKDFIGFLKDIHIHHLVRDIILAADRWNAPSYAGSRLWSPIPFSFSDIWKQETRLPPK